MSSRECLEPTYSPRRTQKVAALHMQLNAEQCGDHSQLYLRSPRFAPATLSYKRRLQWRLAQESGMHKDSADSPTVVKSLYFLKFFVVQTRPSDMFHDKHNKQSQLKQVI